MTPVAVFVYNRPDNTRRTLQCLAANTLAKDTDVYVFSDGGKDAESWKRVGEVRKVLREFEESKKQKMFKSFTICERPENYYLERNIIEGINQVLTQHETVVVLEDDICTSPYFLQYMNETFDIYRDDKRVMHVSGFTRLDLINAHPDMLSSDSETYFSPHMAGWGWGTWRDRWQKHFVHYTSRAEALEGLTDEDISTLQYGGAFPCFNSLDKDPIPWDICWGIAIQRAKGLCLYPAYTLVQNIGLGNGTHFRAFKILQHYNYNRKPLERPIVIRQTTPTVSQKIEALFADAVKDWGIRYTLLGKVVRYFYKKGCRFWVIGYWLLIRLHFLTATQVEI